MRGKLAVFTVTPIAKRITPADAGKTILDEEEEKMK